jgi:hypothetical protein
MLANFPNCYACDAPKTSMEHAPPRCFFPETKDANGHYLFRTNLITVPSCDAHNAEKSGDDAYALWHLAGLDGVNGCGEMMHAKLHRMREHDRDKRGGSFARRLVSESVGFTEDGRVAARADGPRMERFLCSVAQAVYFFETCKKLLVPLRVTNIGNCARDADHLRTLQEREAGFDAEMGECEVLGANPQVFQYSIRQKSNGIILVRMAFYGTLKHWVFHQPKITN